MRGRRSTRPLLVATAVVLGATGLIAPAGVGAGANPPAPAVVVHDGVVYGHDRGEPVELDEYLPKVHLAPVPAVIVIHGGGWTGGNRSETKSVAVALARNGLAAFNIGYRLAAPGSKGFPGEVDDAEQAVAYVEQHAASLGVAPDEIGAFGASAGGTLALELGTLRRDLLSPAPFVGVVVSWSGPTDLVSLAYLGVRSCTPLSACPRGSLRGLWYWGLSEYLGCDLKRCRAPLREASPITYVRRDGASLMLWNSTDELVPVSQVDDLAARARAVGEPVTVDLVPGHGHATEYIKSALTATIAFFRQHLGG